MKIIIKINIYIYIQVNDFSFENNKFFQIFLKNMIK